MKVRSHEVRCRVSKVAVKSNPSQSGGSFIKVYLSCANRDVFLAGRGSRAACVRVDRRVRGGTQASLVRRQYSIRVVISVVHELPLYTENDSAATTTATTGETISHANDIPYSRLAAPVSL